MPAATAQRLRTLLEAAEIVHNHGAGSLQDRVMAACQHLFPESYHGFELWDLQTGVYEGVVNAPFDPAALQDRFQRLATTEDMEIMHLLGLHTVIAHESDKMTISP